jgi:acyl-CoA hydrolase
MNESPDGGVPISQSRVTLVRLMLPTDVNFAGNVFGGTVMRALDEVAYVVASRHARRNVVTASVDRMDFLAPLHLRDVVHFTGQVTYVGRSSMEIWVHIEAEDLYGTFRRTVGNAYVTMVALDEDGRPTPVPPLRLTSDEERVRFEEGRRRALERNATRPRPSPEGA